MANQTIIQIKRSLTTAAPGALANGELAYTSNGDVLYIGANGSVIAIGGSRNPGTLTANQAIVTNSTSGVDKVIVANLVPTVITANGLPGTPGYYLTSNGNGIYWSEPTSGVAGSNGQIQFNDNGSLAGDSGLTYNKDTDTLTVGGSIIIGNSTSNASINSTAFSSTANNATYAFGKSEGNLNVNSAATANNSAFLNGKSEGNLNVNTALTSNNSSFLNGKSEGNLNVNSASSSLTANNSAFLNGKSEGNLNVNSASFATTSGTANNATYAFGKSEGNLNVNSAATANNSAYLGGTIAAAYLKNTGSYTISGVHTHTANLVTQDIIINGNTVLGSNSSDTIRFNGLVSSNLIPTPDNTHHLGNNTLRWGKVYTINIHSTTGYFDGTVEIAGDLIVSGNVTTVNTSSIVVSDSKILLAANNPSDILDIGFSGIYTDLGSVVRHAGLFRDASDNGIFKFFSNTTQNLTGNNIVDTGDASFRIGTLETYLKSSGILTNSSSVSIAANSTISVTITANTLSLSTPLAVGSGGTGKSTFTADAVLVGNGTSIAEVTGSAYQVLQLNATGDVVFGDLDGGTF